MTEERYDPETDYASIPEHLIPEVCGTDAARWTDAFLDRHPDCGVEWGDLVG